MPKHIYNLKVCREKPEVLANNMFQIIIYNVHDEITSVFDYRLQDGNPNVNDIRTNLNNLLLNKVVISYDKIKTNLYIKELWQ